MYRRSAGLVTAQTANLVHGKQNVVQDNKEWPICTLKVRCLDLMKGTPALGRVKLPLSGS